MGRKYWNKLKQRLSEEGSQLVTNCRQLKMTAKDGKKRLTGKSVITSKNAAQLQNIVTGLIADGSKVDGEVDED